MSLQKGFAAISIVLTLLAVSVALSLSILFLSLGEARSSLSFYQGESALALVESCGEDVLLRIRNDETFSENRIMLPEGECQIDFSGEASDQTISVVGTKDGYTRNIEIRVSRTETGLSLRSWLER